MNKHIGIMTDRLVEISRDDWPRLKELYTPDGSKSYLAYTTIDSCIRCLDQDPNYEHFKVYCLNGDFSDGTFVATVSSFVALIGFVCPESGSLEFETW